MSWEENRFKIVRIFLFSLIVIFSLSNVSALIWSNTTFNNSLTTENLTFIGNENITRFLAIPKSVESITTAYLNLTNPFFNTNIDFLNFNTVLLKGFIDGWTLDGTGDIVTSILGKHNGTNRGTDRNITGLLGNASFFNGTSDLGILISDEVPIGSAERTVCVWFNVTGNGFTNVFSYGGSNGGSSNGKRFSLAVNTNTTDIIDVRVIGESRDTLLALSPLGEKGIWNNLCGIYNGTDVTVIFNAGQNSSETHVLDTDPLLNITIGSDVEEDDTEYFEGTIDDLWIWNRTLTDFEVDFLYNNGIGKAYPFGSTVENVFLEVGILDGIFEFNFSGQFNQTNNRTDNLFSAVNSFLSSCTIQNGFCLVPFLFHSDTAGTLQYLNLLFSNEGFRENSQTFQTSTFDTARETFQINISFDSGRYTDTDATLVYNTTRITSTETGTGNERIFTALEDIDVVSTQQNVTFYWEIAMTDSSGQTLFNSTFNNQTVDPSNLIQCGAGSRAINYTTYDEGDQSLLVTDFDATFTWKLNTSSSITKNVSVSLSSANNYQFCINTNKTFFTDVDINLDATGFSERTFGFNQEEFTNVTTDQQLYLLNDTLGTNVILKLKDVGLFPLSDYTIKIFRKLASGTEILVENDITYRFEFFDPDNKLVKTIQTSIIACTTTICQQTFIIQSLTGAFEDFDDLEDHTFGFSFDNDTRTFSFSWVDNREESQTHRLLIEKITFSNGTEVVFNSTSTSNSNVLSFTADTSTASYRASAFRKVGDDENRLGLINISIGDNSNIFSFEGLYWSLIFFMLLLLVGRFHPPTGIILYLFGVFMLGIFDIVFINPAIMIAQLVLGVLFIWAWR